ncbi:complement C2-like protein [Labeo rohita]|uniref:C3/C5 convertase n=1 Tax=Labeo rohita TaxID=84645 RepID=A0A498M4L7_LABRO|nr:complement C2-like protein [Labeo rohita]
MHYATACFISFFLYISVCEVQSQFDYDYYEENIAKNCTTSESITGGTVEYSNGGAAAEDCKNPGTPPGALRSGQRFRIRDRVRYQCQSGLDMLGPSERQCLDSREWSGTEPRCYAQYSYDQPAAVAQALGGSLTAVMDVSLPDFKKQEQGLGRTIKVAEGRLNVFILLDTSASITPESFLLAKNATVQLVQKLDSYEVNMKFDIVSYASKPREIVSITNDPSDDVDYVLRKLKEFSGESHGNERGTNLHDALDRVYNQLALLRENKRSHFNETQNVIIIATDGHSNMGPSPQTVLPKIRHLLGYKPGNIDHTQEERLDVYVFAVGAQVNKKELISIASSKRDEHHVFVLKDYRELGLVFNQMISDSAVTKCGVAQEELDKSEKTYTARPWHVDISWMISGQRPRKCRGSILTKSMVLTAAHCLIKVESDESVSKANAADVTIEYGNGQVKALELILHPQFNLKGLKDKNIKEFYDYDVALIRMSAIKISVNARPICLPCTGSSNRALRLAPDSTCDQHKKLLLHLDEIPAQFISQGTHRSDTRIHTGAKRAACIDKARSTIPEHSTASVSEVVTDRFLCTGGSEKNRVEMTCKGDSGGSLFLRKRMRYFQVAVVSWGTEQICGLQTAVKKQTPDARDFHISVFPLMPWLKQYLDKELVFLP